MELYKVQERVTSQSKYSDETIYQIQSKSKKSQSKYILM